MESGNNSTGVGRGISISAFVVALVGLADAGYLTAKHYSGLNVPCSLINGCDTVLKSSWAEFFGYPTALYGAVAYFIAFSLAFLVYSGRVELWKVFGVLATLMFVASLGFLYIQAFVIGAFCQYCLLSLATSTLLFVIYIVSLVKKASA